MGSGEVHRGFWWGELMETDHLEHLGLDGRMNNIVMDLQEFRWRLTKWIDLVRCSDSLRTLVNSVKNIRAS